MRSKAIFMALLAFAFGAQAVPVTPEQAKSIAQMWASRGKRLGVRMGTEVENVAEYVPANDRKFFAVRMKGGTVFTAGDTRQNPVLAFTRERIEKLDPKSPLYALLSNAVQGTGGSVSAVNAAERSAMRQWTALQAKADFLAGSQVPIESEEEIDDVRVSPLLKTKWGQSTAYDENGNPTNCFNFYTPQTYVVVETDMVTGRSRTNENGNCVCGCVATAMAQLMRYWCWPQGERASFSNKECSAPSGDSEYQGEYIDGTFHVRSVMNPTASVELSTTAGAYDWENMVELPLGLTEANCSAIGKLTYDCGVSVGMGYNVTVAGGSGILASKSAAISTALQNNFSYPNALLCTSGRLTSSDSCRQKVIFANLDAKCPVLLLITGDGGHAVVGDGYGFDSDEEENLPYVHLNMGWTGQCDVWYNLPYVNTADNPEHFSGFDTISGAIYNVFTNETGWIISGRALNAEGNAVPGTKVTLSDADGVALGEFVIEEGDEKGIYSFIVPTGGMYDLHAESSDGKQMADRLVEIKVDNATGGNSWGNDLTLADPTVRVIDAAGVTTNLFASLDSALRAATNADDRVEILHTTKLRRDTFLGNDLVLTAVKATPSKIQRTKGATISITNGVAFLTNVVFALEKTTPVLVLSNGKIAVAGRVELDDISSLTPGIWLEGTNNFVLAGELANGLTIACPATKAGQDFGSYSCDLGTATRSAVRIVTEDPSLVGKADDSGKLVWQDAEEVDPSVAVAYLDGETPAYYRTLDRLLEKVEGEADIVIMRSGCRMTNRIEVAGNSSIRGETANLAIEVFGLKDQAQFTIGAGASLMVSNLTFTGYTGKSLFRVENGGALTLEDGAVIDGAVGTAERTSGAIAVAKGSVTLRPGARIVNCRADGTQANGGAIWLGGAGCTLNLEGGEISGCWATSYGGGIYVGGNATLNISGTVNVTGNSSGNNPVDNIYLAAATSSFKLVGEVSGSIGVRHFGSIPGNKVGDAFIAVDPSLDPEIVAQSCEAFSNDTNGDLVAEVAEDGLIWTARPPYTGEVDPEDEDAYDLVIYNDGTPQAVTNYFESFEYAYASLTNDATIVVLGVELLTNDVKVTRKVVIRTDDPVGDSGLYRVTECKFTVVAGGSLVLEDIVMSGSYRVSLFEVYGGSTALLKVENGGSLVLGSGAFVCDVYGDGSRAAGGIVVQGGEFRMLPGSEIYDCGNAYPRNESVAVSPANIGVGGGLLVDHGTAYLEGGWVDDCWAERAAGVYIGNESTVYISGDMVIANNFTNNGEPSNLTVEDKSTLVLVDDFTGSIGVSDGISCDTNVFGRVDVDYYSTASFTALTNGAANFVHDVRNVHGIVATNGTENALLVWSDAFVNEGGVLTFTYVDEDGVTWKYGALGATPSPGPLPPDPPGPHWEVVTTNPTAIAFRSIDRVSDTEWALVITNRVEFCNYRLLWTEDLTKGFTSTGEWEHAVGPAANPVWTTNVITTGGAWFWRAEGKDGTNMVLKTEE